MGRKIWLAFALVVIAATCSAAGAVAAKQKAATDPRPKTVTKGLDYFHARQKTDGGFGTMAATAWVILGAVASGERVGSTMWTLDGNNPFSFLQANSHEAAATGPDVDNAPVYYARAIMSYVAADRPERVFRRRYPAHRPPGQALQLPGSGRRLAHQGQLLAVHVEPQVPGRPHHRLGDPRHAGAGRRREGPVRARRQWLATQQLSDGGFPAQVGEPANCEDTAVAIQALELAADVAVDPAIIPAARQYLKANQRADGGFPYKPGTGTDAWATAAAIQAILAMGEDPDGADWMVGTNTPKLALATLQLKNGAYVKKRGDATGPLPTTSWALVALRDKPFTTFPATRPPALKAFVFRPQTKSVLPKDGQKYTNTHSVLIRATYTDGAKGTGVDPAACRVYVDDLNKTKPADIGRYRLQLQLKNLVQRRPHVQARDRRSRRQRQEAGAPLHDRRPDADAHADAPLHPDPGPPLHTAPGHRPHTDADSHAVHHADAHRLPFERYDGHPDAVPERRLSGDRRAGGVAEPVGQPRRRDRRRLG